MTNGRNLLVKRQTRGRGASLRLLTGRGNISSNPATEKFQSLGVERQHGFNSTASQLCLGETGDLQNGGGSSLGRWRGGNLMWETAVARAAIWCLCSLFVPPPSSPSPPFPDQTFNIRPHGGGAFPRIQPWPRRCMWLTDRAQTSPGGFFY